MNIYSMGTSVLLENTPLVKIHTKLHPGLEWRIFHILTSEDVDDVTDIKFVSLIVPKFDRWCIIESSSSLFPKSSVIFGDFQKMFGNVRFGKWSEIFGKSSNPVCLYNKKNITRPLEDTNFMFLWLRSLVGYCSCRGNITFISSHHRVIISSIYTQAFD